MADGKDVISTDSQELNEYVGRRGLLYRLFGFGIVLTLITNFPSAFTHTSVNTAVLKLDEYIKESYDSRGVIVEPTYVLYLRSLMNSIWYAGQVAGALISPSITDKWGRKPAYLLSTACMTVACCVQTISTLFPYPEVFIIGRVFASFFSPMSDAVLILYLQEITPSAHRGKLSSLFATGYSALALVGMITGMEAVAGHSLTNLLAIPIIPGLLGIAFLLYIPETPKFLISVKNNTSAALESIRFFHGSDLVENMEMLEEIAVESASAESTKEGHMSDLFTVKRLRKALCLSFAILTLTLPFYPILQSSTHFLLYLQIDPHVAQLSSTIMTVVLVVCCIGATIMVDKFGRRPLLVIFGSLSIVALIVFVVSAYFVESFEAAKYIAYGGLLGYIMCYGLAIGPISYFISAEIVDLKHRATIFCVNFSINSLFIVATNFLTILLVDNFGPVSFVPLFIIPSLIAVVYVILYMPETKDLDANIIGQLLEKGSIRHSQIYPHIDNGMLENVIKA